MNSTSPLVKLMLAALGFSLLSGPILTFWTDWLWFDVVGYADVLLTRVGVQFALFAGAALLAFLLLRWNAGVALSASGPRANLSAEFRGTALGMLIQRLGMNRFATLLSLGLAFFVGMTATTWWPKVLLAIHGGEVGFTDPTLGYDAGFYLFTLPVLDTVRFSLGSIVLLCGASALAIYVSLGAIRMRMVEEAGELRPDGLAMSDGTRRHLANLAAAFLILMAVGTYLRRFQLMYDPSGLFTGPGYSDLYGTLPLLTLQAVVTLISAYLVYVAIDRERMGMLATAVALVFGTSALTGMYPSLVQRFLVEPNELNTEAPHIQDHIAATRFAFRLNDIEERSLSGENSLQREDIDNNHATINNIRLWDHEPLLATFAQIQEIRTQYRFLSVDNDRYMIDGELRQIMLSPREFDLQGLPREARTWVNEHITYTHGYGLTLGPVNKVNPQGLPELFVQDLPPTSTHPDDLSIEQPAIYYGETRGSWVLVNTDSNEFDYPVGEEVRYTQGYEGRGGVSLAGANRMLFALRFGSSELFFSRDIVEKSRLLMYRNIRERVLQVAPFLTLDRDPYLVIEDGRMVWILDTYVTSSTFPYAQAAGRLGNYIRNTVKVTVDAFDGSVNLYAVQPDEPITKAWAAAFPTLFKDEAELSDNLKKHYRYPQDLFAIQSELFGVYHMTDHQVFYNREDEWQIPSVAGELGQGVMAPYYTIMRLPGEASEEFILMRPLSPRNKPNLAAWIVARMDGEHYGNMVLYKFPKQKLIYGPVQIASRINQDTDISREVSLWNQQGSKAEFGTMLVLPIEESLIYVQPLYIRATSREDALPELKRVIVAYEDRIAMERTLEDSLDVLFGGTASQDVAVNIADAPVADNEPSDQPTAWVDRAQRAYSDAVERQRAGDWAGYGEALEELETALTALKAQQMPPKDAPESDPQAGEAKP